MKIVNVSAPAINSVFNTSGVVQVQDISSPIWGSGFLQSRILTGQPGAPAAGLYVYEYRVDLRNVVGVLPLPSITSLELDFGPVVGTLDYDGDHSPDQIFVTTKGGLGNVTPSSASEVGSVLTFAFNQPVSGGSSPGKGNSSYFFGLVSKYPPHQVTATAKNNKGPDLSLHAYAPNYPKVPKEFLDEWLSSHPAVASHISWRPEGGSDVAWASWTESQKADLRKAYKDAGDWYDSGMTAYAGPAYTDPPENLLVPQTGGYTRTVIAAATAWSLYVARVAHCLAAEIKGWVPYSIQGYSFQALGILLGGSSQFCPDSHAGDYYDFAVPGAYAVASGELTPSHPTYVFGFLKSNNLLGSTAKDTIGRVLGWCNRLVHQAGTAEDTWHYSGMTPLRYVIEGTVLTNPNGYKNDRPRHWTGGCGGTTSFLRTLLRDVNIPVGSLGCGGGHLTPNFVAQQLYLSHGDDPYTFVDAEGAALLAIPEPTFNDWFRSGAAKASDNVGRKVAEVAVYHPGLQLLFHYCQDLALGKDHASGGVYECFKRGTQLFYPDDHFYTVAELEASGLWPRLAAQAQLQGCEINIRRESTYVFAGTVDPVGTVPTGQASLTYTIQNGGTADLTLGGISFSALQNVDTPTLLAAPSTPLLATLDEDFTVRFNPTTKGDFSFVMTVASNDPKQSSFAITVEGTAPGTAKINIQRLSSTIVADSVDSVGSVPAGQLAEIDYTIENVGGADLAITEIQYSDLQNVTLPTVVAAPTSPVLPLQSTHYIIRFAPQVAGDFSFGMCVISDDPNQHRYDITVSGTSV